MQAGPEEPLCIPVSPNRRGFHGTKGNPKKEQALPPLMIRSSFHQLYAGYTLKHPFASLHPTEVKGLRSPLLSTNDLWV